MWKLIEPQGLRVVMNTADPADHKVKVSSADDEGQSTYTGSRITMYINTPLMPCTEDITFMSIVSMNNDVFRKRRHVP